jgi:cytochrome c553
MAARLKPVFPPAALPESTFDIGTFSMKLARRSLILCLALIAIASQATAADPDRARQIVSGRCFLCHGMSGESSSEVFPRLATQNAAYLAKQLRDFQSARRKGSTMNEMVAGLTEADMAALGEFFAGQTAAPHAPSDVDLAAAGRYLAVASKLTELEIRALAEYLASVP